MKVDNSAIVVADPCCIKRSGSPQIGKSALYGRPVPSSGGSDKVSVYASKKIIFEEQLPLPDFLKEGDCLPAGRNME